ncbi:uncharacterized protein LOC121267139 [Juglans microcarpa x Juglans regia]|uniref:uncharacterized protein LOC121267139 n=1 Tax=Juglans microcarpa x Juglans regia TaxID=2249226 RepID=UPI001B7DDB71|nr:uncharacterized protein LOC121267139 [Juglans microcarpa x Juglans regia]
MGISLDRLRPSPSPLKGFSLEAMQPIGAIILLVTVGQGVHTVTSMTDFLMVKAPLSYNAILGRSTLNNLKVVTSTYHFKMKFLTKVGFSKVQGEQILVRELRPGVKDGSVGSMLGR